MLVGALCTAFPGGGLCTALPGEPMHYCFSRGPIMLLRRPWVCTSSTHEIDHVAFLKASSLADRDSLHVLCG